MTETLAGRHFRKREKPGSALENSLGFDTKVQSRLAFITLWEGAESLVKTDKNLKRKLLTLPISFAVTFCFGTQKSHLQPWTESTS